MHERAFLRPRGVLRSPQAERYEGVRASNIRKPGSCASVAGRNRKVRVGETRIVKDGWITPDSYRDEVRPCGLVGDAAVGHARRSRLTLDTASEVGPNSTCIL